MSGKLLFVLLILIGNYPYCIYSEPITITAVGDNRISHSFIQDRYEEIRLLSLKGDIIFANFEGVIVSPTNDQIPFSMPLSVIPILRDIGINTISLANNHVSDLGKHAYEFTKKRLTENGFYLSGIDDDGVVIPVKHLKVRLIAFSFTGRNNVNNIRKAVNIIKQFQEDIIIVSAHMGGENAKGYLIPDGAEYFQNEKRGDVVAFSRSVIDAGADLVLGHGPHVLRRIEIYKQRLIAYSLGNFIFDYPQVNKNTYAPGAALTVKLNSEGKFIDGKIACFIIRYGIPAPDKSLYALRWIKKLSSQNDLRVDDAGNILKKGD